MELNIDRTLDYWEFVEERHRVWERRQAGEPGPWTAHPILRERKFTNVYRILDPGSQFLAGMLCEPGLSREDVLTRALLYRLTNLPEPWEYARKELGRYPVTDDLGPDLVELWTDYQAAGHPVLTSVYIVYPGPGGLESMNKIRTVVERTRTAMEGETLRRWQAAGSLQERFEALRAHKGIGDFIAMQSITDFGYSPHGADTENDFVVAGPGSRRGALAVAPGARPEDTIHHFTRLYRESGAVLLRLPDGRQRSPSLMDVQNTFCEFSKLVRFFDRGLTGKTYQPAHPGVQPEPFIPAHW